MAKNDYDYLNEERVKLWHRINAVETELGRRIDDELNKKASDYTNEAKQFSRKASEFRNKSEESKNSIIQFLNEAQDKVDKINQVYQSVEILNNEISTDAESAKQYVAQTAITAEEIANSKIEIDSNIQSLENIFEDFEDISDKIERITDLLTNSNNTSSKIEALHKSLLARKTEIDLLYYEIFGYTDKNEDVETAVEGLKDKLEKAYDNLDQDIKTSVLDIEKTKTKATADYHEHLLDWDIKYRNLEGRVEALLPNALTAGLSSAYSEKKNVEILEYKKLNIAFIISICGLVFISIIPLFISYFSLTHDKPFEKVLLDMPRLVVSILPLYIPILWVAYSSNRKMNLSKRLSEEYSHKEVLSKTFEGLSTQINNVSNQKVSEDLKNKLLYNILEVSSENPGKLISDYNKSDHPLMDALDKSVKLAMAFEKLEKIPGFSTLAKKMDKKSKAIVEEENTKATKAINTVDDDE